MFTVPDADRSSIIINYCNIELYSYNLNTSMYSHSNLNLGKIFLEIKLIFGFQGPTRAQKRV